jgi:murein DD-endopeptidase MepM/ murein hydrolase activator NlpD
MLLLVIMLDFKTKMKKIFLILIPLLLSSCASSEPASVEHSSEFAPTSNQHKDLRVRVIKNLNSDIDEDDIVKKSSIDDLKDGDEVDGFTVRVKKKDRVIAPKGEVHEIKEPADESEKNLASELEKEFAHDRAELSDGNKPNEFLTSEDIKQERREIEDTKLSHDNFSILPTDGKIIRKFIKGPEGFEAIIFSNQKGSIIRSVSEGMVVYSGFDPKFGNIVIVALKDLQVAYGYIKEIVVKKGSKVRVGDIIGYIGDIVNAKNSGLYFAIRKNNIAIDPQTLLPQN